MVTYCLWDLHFDINGSELSHHGTFATLDKVHSCHCPRATCNPVFPHRNNHPTGNTIGLPRLRHLHYGRPPETVTSSVAPTPSWGEPPAPLQVLTLWSLYFIYVYKVKWSLSSPLRHNLDIRWRWVISLTHRPLYPQRKIRRHPEVA
jgi:hypothetical protein